MEDALKRLDKLTQEEARMAAAENLRLSHIILNGTPSPVRYSGNVIMNINAHALVRRKTFGKQRRRHQMFVIFLSFCQSHLQPTCRESIKEESQRMGTSPGLIDKSQHRLRSSPR